MSQSTSPDEIRRLAREFRDAITRSPRDDLPTLCSFPRGSCGDASKLLGEYLHEQGQGVWDYVGGERDSNTHSHAWLEKDGLIVDITADQFDDIDEPVVVTRDRIWHQQFIYPSQGTQCSSVGMILVRRESCLKPMQGSSRRSVALIHSDM